MKTFDDKEIIKLKECLASIIGRPTPFNKQESVFGSDGFCLWCQEWELIEMLKYLINGKETYYNDPPPNRLQKSSIWSKEAVEKKVIQELSSMTTVDQIIDYFKKRREAFNETR